MPDPVVKDPLPPEHKRFVLSQAALRLAIAAVVVIAIGAWFFTRG
ncbi:hypothetical protein [Hansschlegelia plantiphila]|uniref:Uncharacterized protein n=1 Tax=Hansschlegelia plantiphila TaxID=374655 RepID=A0A9W6IZ48_9HYPH|nr:hypothetical protein [Hansschlegelia plantiphila]GLK67712.1 hypothetical protein GCM10008179_13500 [Hansschlegelia plantiphila]